MKSRPYRVTLPLLLGCISGMLMVWDVHNSRLIDSMQVADIGAPFWPYEASWTAYLTINAPAFVLSLPVFFLLDLQTAPPSGLLQRSDESVNRSNYHTRVCRCRPHHIPSGVDHNSYGSPLTPQCSGTHSAVCRHIAKVRCGLLHGSPLRSGFARRPIPLKMEVALQPYL